MKYRNLFAFCMISIAAGCSEPTTDVSPDCVNGAMRCAENNTVVQECVNREWRNSDSCVTGYRCDESSFRCEKYNECTSGQMACDSEKNSLLRCMDGVYMVDRVCGTSEKCNAKSGKCEPTEVRPSCTNGEQMCDSSFRRVLACKDGEWFAEETCVDGSECDPSSKSCKKGCAENARRCDEIHNLLMVCHDNSWEIDKNCTQEKAVCNTDTLKCEAEAVCVEGAKSCNENRSGVLSCQGGDWKADKNCNSDEICDNNACQKRCDASAVACSGGNAVNCVGGLSEVTVCDPSETCVVNGGKASCEKFQCSEGSVECKDDGTILRCTGNKWVEESCGSDMICSERDSKCVRKECTAGALKCESNSVWRCENNKWNIERECTGQMCDPDSKSCVDVKCTDGDKMCSSQGVMVCAKNAYTLEKACSDDQTCVGDNAGNASCQKTVCVKGEADCRNGQLYICDNNAWGEPTTCASDLVCDKTAKACVKKECDEGSKVCSSDGKSLLTCENNSKKTTACASDQVCMRIDGVDDCVKKVCNDGTRCDGNTFVTCTNNVETTKNCLNRECDDKLGCIEKPECEKGSIKCENDTPYICSDASKWVDKTKCLSGERCDSKTGECIDPNACKDGDYTCNNGVLQKCENKKFIDEKNCGADICDAKNKTCTPKPECTDGDFQCTGNIPAICEAGKWKNQTACAKACNPELKKCVECEEGAFDCADQVLNVCTKGVWVKREDCGKNKICSSDKKQCVACTGSAVECQGNTLATCVGGSWSNRDCGDSAVCVSADGKAACVDKVELPEWCSINEILDNTDQAYARVLMPTGSDPNLIKSQLVCGNLAQPVSKWHSAVGYYSMNCHNSTCGANAEFISMSLDAPAGSYRCAYRLEFGPQSIACVAKSAGYGDGGKPVVLDDTTKLTEENTMPITVLSPSAQTPPACHFRSVTINDKHLLAYGRIVLPEPTTPAQAKAYLLCGKDGESLETWKKYPGLHNIFCSDCLGFTEYEIETDLAAGDYQCVFAFDLNGNTYACSTNKDGYEAPVIVEMSTTLYPDGDSRRPAGTPVTRWDFSVK